MARASVAWTLQLSTVRRVTAERLEGARTSNRMLEKVGVARVGRRMDDEARYSSASRGPQLSAQRQGACGHYSRPRCLPTGPDAGEEAGLMTGPCLA